MLKLAASLQKYISQVLLVKSHELPTADRERPLK